MKIGVLQQHMIVGDFSGNAKRLAAAYQDAVSLGAEIVVGPEDAIAGYCEGDQRFYPSFIAEHDKALRELAGAVGAVGLVMSITTKNSGEGKPFYNMAVLIQNGKVTDLQPKTNLATDTVFSDYRFYEMNRGAIPVFEYRGKKFAALICQDIWQVYDAAHGAHYFPRYPVTELRGKGVDLILVPNASPYYWGKGTARREMVASVVKELGCAVAYANYWGGQDELVFDGRSFIMNKDGRVVGRAKPFEDAVIVASLDGDATEYPPDRDEVGALEDALLVSVRDYVEKNRIKGVVIGLSGGIDSAVVAALAAKALGPDRVIGVRLPSAYSSEGSLVDAEILAKNLGIRLETVPIASIYESLRAGVAPAIGRREPGAVKGDVTEENMQARIRGMILMSFSNRLGFIPIATGNKSEFSVGFATLYGDMCGGFALIKDVLKRDVYRLAEHMNRAKEVIPKSSITKPPSAELRPNQVDADSLPDYPILDPILALHVEEFAGVEEIVAKGFDRKTAERVVQMTAGAEFKRRQAPPGPIVSREGLAWLNRQYPISTSFMP